MKFRKSAESEGSIFRRFRIMGAGASSTCNEAKLKNLVLMKAFNLRQKMSSCNSMREQFKPLAFTDEEVSSKKF